MNNINTPPGVITCKAAVLRKAGEALQIEEIKVDPPKAYEIRIKMLYASICHTDSLCDNVLYPLFPMVPGHEGVGQIESVGDKVTNLKEGDFVVPLYIGECGECLNCTSGKTNLCHKYPINMSGLMLDGTSRMTSVLGEKLYHHITCSTWSEYTVVEAGYVAKVDPLLPPSHASFLSCGFATGFGSTYRVVDIEKGLTVAVVGLGPVGLGVVKGAQMLGATKIIGIDANDLKQEKARKFGVTEYINPKSSDKTVSELVKDATGGLGVDYCFECTGVPNLLNEAIEGSKVGLGTVVLIGAGVQTSGELDYVPLLLGRTVKGCIYGRIRPQLDLPNIIQKCLNKEIDLDQLITHEFSIGEINKALEHTKHPDSLKIVLKF